MQRMKICQMIGEPYNHAFYTNCLKCSIKVCPVNHLLERIVKMEEHLIGVQETVLDHMTKIKQ